MKNVYEVLEKCIEDLKALSVQVMQIARTVNEVLTEHDEYKNSFKVIYGGKTGNSNGVESKSTVKGDSTMFTLKDCKIRIKGNSYEIRFRKFGYEKSFTSTKLNDAEARMREFLRSLNKNFKPKIKKAHTVIEWAKKYLENYKKITLQPKSYENLTRVVKLHVIQPLGDYRVCDVKPLTLQQHFVTLLESGKGRTAEDVKTFLNGMFTICVKNGICESNPMDAVIIPKHYRKHGAALTMEEERSFVQAVRGDHYELILLFLLYSGARVSEAKRFNVNDVDFNANVITIQTTKCKDQVNGAPRTVPIFPYLKPVLVKICALGDAHPLRALAEKAGKRFKELLPAHHLHELRHTFTTRCRECGIDNEVTSLWTGHSFAGNTTSRVYTHFSREFQEREAQKLRY